MNAVCAQHVCCRYASAVCDSAGCYNRAIYSINHLRNKCHCCCFTNMTACLRTFSYYGISSCSCNSDSQSNICHYRDNLDSGFLKLRNVLARIACSCSNYSHLLLAYNIHKLINVRCQQHDINSERLICKLSCSSYFCSEPFCISAAGSNYAQSSAVAYSRCQITLSDPSHGTLNNRIFST